MAAFSLPLALGLGLVISVFYLIATGVYRLFIHPLAKFPGPKLAALSYKYEFYWDGIRMGQYTNKIAEYHEKYGPIVRINPDELHVNDPAFIDVLYSGKRDKWQYYTQQLGIDHGSTFTTVEHGRHKLRRAAIMKFFSRNAVLRLESTMMDITEKFNSQLEANAGTGKPVNLSDAYSCLTTEVISEYAYGMSYGFLERSSFEPNLRRGVLVGTAAVPAVKQWPWIYSLLKSLPDSIITKVMPEMSILLKFQKNMMIQVDEIKAGKDVGYEKRSESGATIFHELLNSDLPPHEKSVERLGQEAEIIVGAGIETTSTALAALTFYLKRHPTILARLRSDLQTVMQDTDGKLPSWIVLEKLPYWNATIHEALRLTYGLASRLARISHEPVLFTSEQSSGQKTEWVIPPGTPVGMTSVHIHQNPSIFPDPLVFSPERWLDDAGRRSRSLDRYLLSFSKGSRQCLGMDMAYAEMYLTLAHILVSGMIDRMELFETTEKDVEYDHDQLVPAPVHGSKGIRVLIREA